MSKNKAKIGLICSSTSYGGLEINVIRLANWLIGRGNDITLLCVKDSPLYVNASNKSIPLICINKNLKYFDYFNAFLLSRLVIKIGFSHIVVHHTRDISLCALAKIFSGNSFKLIYQQQMQLGVDKKDFLHTFRFTRIDTWVAPLPWLARQATKRTHVAPDKVKTIALGIELASFKNVKNQKKEALNFFSLPGEKRYIGIIGRIDPLKGQLDLIRAFKLLKNNPEYANLGLLIVGEPTKNEGDSYMNLLLSETNHPDMADSFFIKPFTEHITRFFAVCDVVVMASKGETYGMVTLEAVASQCVVVGSNSGGTPDLVPSWAGELFEPGNITDLAAKLEIALSNQGKYYSTEEYNQFISKFAHTHECEQFEELFNS